MTTSCAWPSRRREWRRHAAMPPPLPRTADLPHGILGALTRRYVDYESHPSQLASCHVNRVSPSEQRNSTAACVAPPRRSRAPRPGATRRHSAVNVEFPKNHITAIIGPTGCAKTTLLRVMNRLQDTDSYIEVRKAASGRRGHLSDPERTRPAAAAVSLALIPALVLLGRLAARHGERMTA